MSSRIHKDGLVASVLLVAVVAFVLGFLIGRIT